MPAGEQPCRTCTGIEAPACRLARPVSMQHGGLLFTAATLLPSAPRCSQGWHISSMLPGGMCASGPLCCCRPAASQQPLGTHVGEALLLPLVVRAVLRHGSKLQPGGRGSSKSGRAAAAPANASRHRRRRQLRVARPLRRRACKRAIGTPGAVYGPLAAARVRLGRKLAITPCPAHV